MLPREQSDLVGVHAPRQGLWTASGGAQGGSQDADSHSAVQQPGGECDGAYRQPRAALCLELLQEHGGGEALAPCLPVCIASFVAGLVHSIVASDGPSAQLKEQPKQHRLVSRSPHTSCQGVLA